MVRLPIDPGADSSLAGGRKVTHEIEVIVNGPKIILQTPKARPLIQS